MRARAERQRHAKLGGDRRETVPERVGAVLARESNSDATKKASGLFIVILVRGGDVALFSEDRARDRSDDAGAIGADERENVAHGAPVSIDSVRPRAAALADSAAARLSA